jgi:tetratricopeptide (TPR) repeat protein
VFGSPASAGERDHELCENAQMVAAAPQSNRWLFGPVPDILVGCGVAYMAFFVAMVFAGPALRMWLPMGLLPLVSVFFGTPHYGATLLRVYEQRAERRAYAFFTVWLTLVVAALYVGGLYSAALGSFLLSLYLTWSPWHYTGQNYGVALLFLRRRGVEITPSTKRFLYASFVLSYFLTFLAIHGAAYSGDYAPVEYNGSLYRFLRFGIPAPYWGYAWAGLGLAYVACIALAAKDLIGRAQRVADLVPTALVMATQLLWFSLPPLGRELGLLSNVDPFRPDNASFLFIWVAAGHAAQYLWITAYYAGEKTPAARARYYAKCVFAGSAIWSLPVLLYVWSGLSAGRFGGVATGEDAGVLVAAMVNIHHFMIDGAIWKLRDGRVARVLIRREAPDVSGTISVPHRRWLAPILLGAGALWTFTTVATLVERDRGLGPALAAGDVAAAEAALGRLAFLQRDGPADYNRVAKLAAQRDDTSAVLRVIDRSIERHDRATTWQTKGAYLEKIGKRDEALAALEAGVRAHPDDPDLLHAAGRLQLLQGNVESALATLEHAKAVAPGDARIELTLERAREKRAAEAPTPSGA